MAYFFSVAFVIVGYIPLFLLNDLTFKNIFLFLKQQEWNYWFQYTGLFYKFFFLSIWCLLNILYD
jgi:hypothetical protein